MKTTRRNTLICLILGLSFAFLAGVARAGSVSGRILDASGRPIAGAKVQWMPYRDEDETLLDQTRVVVPKALGETASDAQGRFRVPLEKAGQSVAVRVQAPGLAFAWFPGPYESSEDVSLFDIALVAPSPISGRVVDESGKPVVGARVLVATSQGLVLDADERLLSEARTGNDGTFAMADAPDGPRALIVRAPGFVPMQRIQIEPRGQESVVLQRGGVLRGSVVDAAGKPVAEAIVTTDDAAAMTDSAGNYEITGVAPGVRYVQVVWKEDLAARHDSLRVKKGEAVVVALKLARAASISGAIVEEGSKRPISGARVFAYGIASGPFARRQANRSTRTDARGRYRLAGLSSRPYLVEATRDGYLASSIAHVEAAVNRPGAANLALRHSASVAGRVVDEKGQAVAGASVRMTQEMGLRGMMRRGMAAAASMFGPGILTGPDGSFRLRNLTPAKNLELEASKSGYATAHQPGITLKPADAMKDVSLTLHLGLQAKGRVVDAANKPVAGAEIRIALQESGLRGIRGRIRLAGMDRDKPNATSGEDGTFVVHGLEEGQYSATVAREGYGRKSSASLPVKAKGENVWPPIVLAPGLSIVGYVHDSAGQAVAGAQVLAIDPGAGTRPIDTSSGPDGTFRMDGFAADRPLMLNVSAQGYAAVQKNVTPPVADLAIVLKTSGTIRGRVEDADKKTPVTDFTISRTVGRGGPGGFALNILAGGAGGGDRAFQSDDGTFELTDVAPGKWTVRATASGYRPADISGVEVGEGETREGVVISLKSGGGLAGRVIDPQSGTGVANAAVSWTSGSAGGGGGGGGGLARFAAGGPSNTSTTTDADGHFSFDGMSDGKVMVTATHPDYLDVTREVDLAKETSVDLTLGTGGSISGTVVGQDGRTPIPGAQVTLNPEGDTGGNSGNDSARADGSGGFVFEHLAAGRFKVTAQSTTGKTTATEVVLGNGQPLTGVLLQMAAGTLVSGTVSGLPAGRLGGVRITASAPNYSDNTQTDDSGNFQLQNVPSGAVRFNATTSFVSGRSTSASAEIPDGAPQYTMNIAFQGASRLSGRVTRGSTALSGLSVNAFPMGDAASTGAGRSNSQTDENGQYALEGLSDGDYSVSLSGQGVNYRKTFTISGDTPGDVSLPPIQVQGTVTEAGSGEPLDSVTVRAQIQQPSGSGGGFGMKTGVTDSTGHYFIDDVDSGSYQVTAQRNEYQMLTQSLAVGGDNATLDFGLQRGEGVSIRVADGGTGLPLRSVNAAAMSGAGAAAFRGSVMLDSTGKGEISSLAPGSYVVHLFADGYAPTTSVVNAPSSLVTLTMTPGGSVEVTTAVPFSGQVVDGSGQPYQASMFRPDGTVNASPPVVSWIHFTPGSYQLLVGAPGAQKPYPFTVVEGQTTRVVVN